MKISIGNLSGPAAAIILSLAAMSLSCNKVPSGSGQGSLSWGFSSGGLTTRSVLDLPDTDAFILTVRNSAEEILYRGPYGDSPESMLVNPGTYSVSAVSREFSLPEFDAPQFGDEQAVVVKAGAVSRAVLDCYQLNCGIRFKLGPDFAEAYPDGSLAVTSAEGSLDYGKEGSRTGYFKPGNLAIMLHDGQESTRLLTRTLQSREILTLGITCPSSSGPASGHGGVSISIDTVRVWEEEGFIIGQGAADAGATMENAYGISQAKGHAGEKGVWVCGFIVGGDLSSAKEGIKFEGPFDSMTNFAIAARSSVSDKASCMSVQLPKGPLREALNLVDHPELLGRKAYLKGDIEPSYYGIPGLKNLTEYSLR